MAQLYKMTLYVCDLEEDLSLDEIKVLIGEQALNGRSVNAICHFADEQIGKQIEWDDDVDLNQWRCPTTAWDKYFTPPMQPKTNADRIRAMSDEELCKFLGECKFCDICEEGCDDCTYHGDCDKRLLEWLQQPAEGE